MSAFARPYAQALLRTTPGGETQVVRAELASFEEAMTKVPALARMVGNPGIPMHTKKKVTADVAQQLGLGEQAKSFVDLLLSNYRLTHLSDILTVVDDLLDREAGVVRTLVTSAHALSESQKSRLADVLSRKLDRRVRLAVEVDEDLLGGFVVQVGSDRYDVSLRGQLDRLETSMAEGD